MRFTDVADGRRFMMQAMRVIVVISVVMLVALSVPVDSAVSEAAECQGRKATMHGSEITGTPRADVIVGTNRKDYLSGGGGNDIICGLGGDDSLSGGQGNDVLRGGTGDEVGMDGGPGRDDIGGGPGKDAVDYSQDKHVRVTLDGQPNDGRPGDRDWLRGDVEGVSVDGGGTVIGNAGPNEVEMQFVPGAVYGEGGADTIITSGGRVYGGDGNDRVFKRFGDFEGAASARIFGGPGNDRIDGTDGFYPAGAPDVISVRDWIACGSGRDTVIRGGLDIVRRDCERVRD